MNHQKVTRRQMLSTLTLGGIAIRAAQIKAAAPGFKIGACDWTINRRADTVALEVAKKIGLDGVMVDIGRLEDDLPLGCARPWMTSATVAGCRLKALRHRWALKKVCATM